MGVTCSVCTPASEVPAPEPKSVAVELQRFQEVIRAKFSHSRGGLRHAFDSLGGEDDGFISKVEFLDFMRKELRYQGDVDVLFHFLDSDSEGRISKEEFVAATQPEFVQKGAMHDFKEFVKKKYVSAEAAFNELDLDGNKNVTKEEFCKALKEHFKFPGAAATIYKALDSNGNQKVSLEEFKQQLGEGEKGVKGRKSANRRKEGRKNSAAYERS